MLKKKTTVSNVNEKLVEHGIHGLPYSYTSDVINVYSHSNYDVILISDDVIETPRLSQTFDNSVVGMITNL